MSIPPQTFCLRPMRPDDIEAVVAVHQIAFPQFFLTQMGPGMLRLYYETVLAFEGRVALVAEGRHPSAIAGFAAGFVDAPAFYRALARRRGAMVPVLVWRLVTRPRLLGAVVGNVLRVLRRGRRDAPDQPDPKAVELASIAVSDAGAGVGRVLLAAFLEAAASPEGPSGAAPRVHLSTDADDNTRTRRFYEAAGFCLKRIEERGARRLCHYVYPLPPLVDAGAGAQEADG